MYSTDSMCSKFTTVWNTLVHHELSSNKDTHWKYQHQYCAKMETNWFTKPITLVRFKGQKQAAFIVHSLQPLTVAKYHRLPIFSL